VAGEAEVEEDGKHKEQTRRPKAGAEADEQGCLVRGSLLEEEIAPDQAGQGGQIIHGDSGVFIENRHEKQGGDDEAGMAKVAGAGEAAQGQKDEQSGGEGEEIAERPAAEGDQGVITSS